MGISGSQPAYKQARAGIMRAGASRANAFTYNHVVTIGGTDRSCDVLDDVALRVELALNDQPDTATFALKPGGTIPEIGALVSVGIGAASNPIFGGQVLRRRDERLQGFVGTVPYIDCIDWQRLFDRRLISKRWTSVSATTILTDVVSTYASGFTTHGIEAGLPTIDEFIATNAAPSEIVRRVTGLIGGAYVIGANRDVRAWGSSGPSTNYAPTPPLTLSTSLSTLKRFRLEKDGSQLRSRVIVEGTRTKTLMDLSTGFNFSGVANLFPIENAAGFQPLTTSGFARVGSQPVVVIQVCRVDSITTDGNVAGSLVRTAANPGDTTLDLDDVTWFTDMNAATGGHPSRFVKVGDQILGFETVDFGVGSEKLTGVGTPGGAGTGSIGPITAPIAIGTPCTPVPMAVISTAFIEAVSAGSDFILRAIADDASAQSTIAAIEGGDGIHEHIVSDGRLSYEGATARAESEIDAFKNVLQFASWETRDMRATPGASQVINLAAPDAVSVTLTITKVRLTFDIYQQAPKRECEAGTLQLGGLRDVVVTATD